MKSSALNVDFNSASFDPLGTRSPPHECIKFVYPLQNARFLLLSTNLARERLQIDTYLLRIITNTVDELYGGTNIDDLQRPWTPKIWGLVNFSLFQAAMHTWGEFSLKLLEIDQDNLRTKLNWCCGASHEH